MTTLSLLAAVLLLAGNAFFVGAEFAVISVRRSQVEPLADGSRRARTVLELDGRRVDRVQLDPPPAPAVEDAA